MLISIEAVSITHLLARL